MSINTGTTTDNHPVGYNHLNMSNRHGNDDDGNGQGWQGKRGGMSGLRIIVGYDNGGSTHHKSF